MEALSGSCLQIPCNFSAKSDFDNKRETFAVWIRSDPRFSINLSNVIFNSSETVNTYPMHITGNLSSKNCTTLFSSLSPNYTDTYFLRIENKPFMATASCNPLKIRVRGRRVLFLSPQICCCCSFNYRLCTWMGHKKTYWTVKFSIKIVWSILWCKLSVWNTDYPLSPRIKISGPLKENESAIITCSAVAPCPQSPPELTWTLQKDPPNKMEENADRTFSTKIQETITLSDKHNGVTIACSVRYRVNDGRNVKIADTKKILEVSCKTTRVCYRILSNTMKTKDLISTHISHHIFLRCSQGHFGFHQSFQVGVCRDLCELELLQQSQSSCQQLRLVQEKQRRNQKGVWRTQLLF